MSPMKASWTLEARGGRWWKPCKESLFDELNPLRDSPFSCSPSSRTWPSSSNSSPSPSVAPFVKWYPLTSSRAQYLLLVNSWLWWVNSAMATAMGYMCWMENGCVTGVEWRSRWRLLKASLFSWWLGLVTLDLFRTMQPFIEERYCKTQKMIYST